MYKPILTRQHPNDPSGIQRIYRFPNGYGASVVQTTSSYGGYEGKWELAVIHSNRDDIDNFELCYNTEITSDVRGWLSEAEVEEILKQIEALPSGKE